MEKLTYSAGHHFLQMPVKHLQILIDYHVPILIEIK